MRKYVPVMMFEHWIYVLALVDLVVISTLLYTVRSPIHFGIW
jgi:hypothetical protein